MKTSLRWLKPALGGLLTGALLCAAPAASAQNFSRAAKHLDTEGDFLAFADFTGSSALFGEHLTAIYTAYLEANPDAMPMPLDFAALFAHMGLDGLSAVGYSSLEVGDDVYRNRGISLIKGEPQGFVRFYDLSPRSFHSAQIAPADATLALDMSLDFTALSDTAIKIAAAIMGPMGQGIVEGGLQNPLLPSGLTGQELISYLSNPFTFVGKQVMDLEAETAGFDFYVELQNAGGLIDHLAGLSAVNPEVSVETAGGDTVVNLSAFVQDAGMELFAKRPEGTDQLLIYSGESFLARIGGRDNLASTPAFKELAARLPEQAAGFTYQTNPVMDQMLEAFRAQPEMAPYLPPAEEAVKRILGGFLAPQVSAYFPVEGGIASEGYAHYSFKEALVAIPIIVVGVTAAMAVPAFQKVRQSSGEKAVTNNLRMFASAGQQYMLETGSTQATYEDIVGPDKYISELVPVAGESYEDLVVTFDDSVLSVELSDGSVVSYEY